MSYWVEEILNLLYEKVTMVTAITDKNEHKIDK